MSYTDLFGKLAAEQATPAAAGKCIVKVCKTIRDFVVKLTDCLIHVVTAGINAVVERFGKIQLRFFVDSS